MTRTIATLMMLPLAAVVAAGCNRHVATQGQEWTCAMHPQYVSDKPGDCPICGMRLVPRTGAAAQPSGAADKPRPLFYRSPMNPNQTSPVPRKDEMGMDYVPVFASAGPQTVTIDPSQQRLIGMKTVEIRKGTLSQTIRTTGRVVADERRLFKVTARFDGFIEKLYADFTGKLVKKGDPLLSIYSPDLLATEQEYLLALKSRATFAHAGLADVAGAARDRLRLFGISDGEIDGIAARGEPLRAMTLHAPISGFITVKTAIAGARVAPEAPLFEVADLSRVWVLADVYEQELPRLKLGQQASLKLSYWPEREWRGQVTYIYPTVDEKTRTVKVRIEVDNPKYELKPEMFGDVLIASAPRSVLLVPDDAVIDSGTRKLVFVVLGEGRLQARQIEVGLHSESGYEVVSGLTEGERVASGASFLLDSEAQLKAAVSSMRSGRDGGAP